MKKTIRYLVITICGILLLTILCFVGATYPALKKIWELKNEAEQIVKAGSSQDFTKLRTSIVYDDGGEILFTYSGAEDVYYATSEEIPQMLKDAFLVMEDQDFYHHSGVDLMAVMRSAIANYDAGTIVQGASTITQQLAKNIYLTQEVEWDRKIKEAFMARALEKKYTKDQILEYYLNNIYFGNGYYGVAAASWGYFGKDVSRLTEGECIFLAAIPNNPSQYDPILHEDACVERALRIVGALYRNQMISNIQYLVYTATEDANPFVTEFTPERFSAHTAKTTGESYIYTYVTDCAVEYLMESRGFSFQNDFINAEAESRYRDAYEEAYNESLQMLYSGGYRIHTSINQRAQALLQKNVDAVLRTYDAEYDAYAKEVEQLVEGAVVLSNPYSTAAGAGLSIHLEEENPLQAAAVTVDNETGYVVAIVGGRNEIQSGYGFNRAYQSYRQPGSSIKPLNVYGPYLNEGHSTKELVYDLYNANGPRNAGDSYGGQITLREAIVKSKNTIAWQIYRYLTPEVGMSYLLRMGFERVYMDASYTSAALGGFTYGVSAEEMAEGFCTFLNEGKYRKATCVTSISYNVGGSEEEEKIAGDPREGLFVYSKTASAQMVDMMLDVIEIGTGKSAKLTAHPAGGKTGTTNGNKDHWFVGFTQYYTTSVWTGYEYPMTIPVHDRNLSCMIWKNYMEELHSNLPPKNFDKIVDLAAVENDQLDNQKDLWLLMEQEKEHEVGEPDLADIWDNDLPMEEGVSGEDENAENFGGDADAAAPGGDTNATTTGGDTNATTTGGDNDAGGTGGNVPSPGNTGGFGGWQDVDQDAGYTSSDADAGYTGSDVDAGYTSSDADANFSE